MLELCTEQDLYYVALITWNNAANDDIGMRVACLHDRNTARAAYCAVDLPDAVVDILTSVRNYLQDKCEPPVYVSDRRFMKAVNLLQVAAFADGRDQVGLLSNLSSHIPQCVMCHSNLQWQRP